MNGNQFSQVRQFVRNHAFAIGLTVVVLIVLLCFFGCEPPVKSDHEAPSAPERPVLTHPPEPTSPPAPGAPDQVAVLADSTARLTLPTIVNVAIGGRTMVPFRLFSARPASYEVIFAQDDTLAAAVRAPRFLDYFRGGLTPADHMGQVLAQADFVGVIEAEFGEKGAPGTAVFDFELEGKAPGRTTIYAWLQRADGTDRVGPIGTEVRVP